jgi:predicted nucleic acid-binding protein
VVTADEHLARASSVCLDANILIYLVEGEALQKARVLALWRAMMRHGIRVLASELAVGECLIGAFKSGVPEITNAYQRLFSEPDEVELWPVDLKLITAAAALGAAHRLKLVDAMHLQSAIAAGCDLFITNDTGFRSGYGVRVVQLNDIGSLE